MKNILSAIQPTGDLHIGNYFGAVQNWVRLQSEYHCTYGVVDYHSMTMPYKAEQLRENTWKMVFYLLACGVKPENLFVQSLIPEHIELSWILGCVTSYGELNRMTQFKEKTDQLKQLDKKEVFVSTGLFIYPVLQAADILMYHADFVPVGKDQEQHLELSRNIAQRFNNQFDTQYFKEPTPLFTETPKILSLADPTKKMSKSLGEKHYINLFGEEEVIRKQIKTSVNDLGNTPVGEMGLGIKNLFEILRACDQLNVHDSLMKDYKADPHIFRNSNLKTAVADALISLINPLRSKLEFLYSQRQKVEDQIQDSSATIRKQAQKTLKEVREIVGLLPMKSIIVARPSKLKQEDKKVIKTPQVHPKRAGVRAARAASSGVKTREYLKAAKSADQPKLSRAEILAKSKAGKSVKHNIEKTVKENSVQNIATEKEKIKTSKILEETRNVLATTLEKKTIKKSTGIKQDKKGVDKIQKVSPSDTLGRKRLTNNKKKI